jgi:hypothetical protein
VLQVYDWEFDVFQLQRLSGGRPLFAVAMALLDREGLLVRAAPAPCLLPTPSRMPSRRP